MKSFIRWAGSKRLLLGHLRSHWTGTANRYIEPFCGSACFFFDIGPNSGVLGDLNQELIGAFRAIRSDPYRVLEALRRFPTGEAGYYRVRKMQPSSLAENERAARFLYLNRYCFNGIYRTNGKGEFNVPYGPPRSGKSVDESVVIAASKALTGCLLVNGDFEHTLRHAQAGDFVYLDPPYCLNDRRIFREYLPGSFSISDLERLRAQLERLDKLGVSFLISYADCAEARKLLHPWKPRRIRARRHIAGFSDKRRTAYEVIATNSPLATLKEET